MVISVALMAFAAQAQAPAAAAAQPTIVVNAPKQAEKVCRRTRETGSHLMKTICRSNDEQRLIDSKARNALRLGNVNPNSPGSSPPPTER